MCPLWLIIGKAALRDKGERYADDRDAFAAQEGGGVRLGDGLSAVVWSLAESWLGGGGKHLERVRRVMDTPVYRVTCSSSN